MDIINITILMHIKKIDIDLHNLVRVPQNCIMMEILGRIEPQVKFHFSPNDISVTTSSNEYVRLKAIRFPWRCP